MTRTRNGFNGYRIVDSSGHGRRVDVPLQQPEGPPVGSPAVAHTGPLCIRCRGTGRELTALENWSEVRRLLLCLMWPEKRVAQFKNSLRKDDIIWELRALSVAVQGIDGRRRTFFKMPQTQVP